jgi:hypothetical protein
MPAVDEMLTIEPPPVEAMARAALCIPSHTPITLTSSTRAKPSLGSSRNGRASRMTAALFTSPSRWPWRSITSSTTRDHSPAWVTSSGRTALPSSIAMSVAITVAPSSAHLVAITAPNERPAPVIKTTLSSSNPSEGTSRSLGR